MLFSRIKSIKRLYIRLIYHSNTLWPHIKKDIKKALSLTITTSTSPLDTTELLFTPIPVTISNISARYARRFSKTLVTLPVATSTTDNLPSVIVPVLSLNKIFKPPAVSIPFNLRTKHYPSSFYPYS